MVLACVRCTSVYMHIRLFVWEGQGNYRTSNGMHVVIGNNSLSLRITGLIFCNFFLGLLTAHLNHGY